MLSSKHTSSESATKSDLRSSWRWSPISSARRPKAATRQATSSHPEHQSVPATKSSQQIKSLLETQPCTCYTIRAIPTAKALKSRKSQIFQHTPMYKEYRSTSQTRFRTRIELMHISDMMTRRIRRCRAASRNLRYERKLNRFHHRRGEVWRRRPKVGSKQMKRKIGGRMIWDWITLKRSRGWLS